MDSFTKKVKKLLLVTALLTLAEAAFTAVVLFVPQRITKPWESAVCVVAAVLAASTAACVEKMAMSCRQIKNKDHPY